MNASPYRTRPSKGRDLNEMQRANLRALLRQMRREHGSWVRVAGALRMRRSSVKGFFDDVEPGNMALARSIANVAGIELEAALDGHFVITTKGIKPIRGT